MSRAKGRMKEGRDRPGGPRRLIQAGVVLIALAAIVVLAYRQRARHTADRAPEPLAIVGMTPEAAYDSALKLGRAGRHEASLPFYRFALAGRPDLTWVGHFNYGSALYNTSLEIRERLGVPLPATRSSIERVALMHAALAQLDTAAQLAPADARAGVLYVRADCLELWGLPWDAFGQLRAAAALGAADPRLTRAAEEYLRLIRNPVPPPAPGATARP